MELMPGYKRTELGMIPEDWDVCKIKKVCKLINGRGFKPHEWKTKGYPIIRIQNLNGSNFFNYFDGYIDNKILVESGQILFAWSGNRGTSFGPHIWRGEKAVLNYHTWKVVVNKREIDQEYFFYALLQLTSFIEENAHGASALVHVQKWEMERFDVALPKTRAEQKEVAKVLADVDASIAALVQLIAKKRAVRQGAMQRLLTGQTRLPGFTAPWRETQLGKLGRFFKGIGVRRDEAQTGDIPCVRYGEIYTTHNDVVRQFASHISRTVAQRATRIQHGDLLFAGSGETKEEIGKCVALAHDVEAYAGGDIIILRPASGNPIFFGYLMNMPYVVRQKANKGQGDTVVHISATALGAIKISLPDEPEQDAIGQVLSDIDAEISTLEGRLKKTRALRQAMMQALLTGRVRLPVPQEAASQAKEAMDA